MSSPDELNPSQSRRGSVVLVYPRTGIDVPTVSVFLPLSVMFVGDALERAGFSVEIIDTRVRRDWKRALVEACQREPLFVGISAMTGRQIHFGRLAARIARKQNPLIPLVWGGIHACVLPEETLADDLVDAVVTGDGEAAAVELARTAVSDRIAIKAKVWTGSAGEEDTVENSSPRTDLSRFDWKPYVTPVVRDKRGLAHVTSRGCPHHCGYCYNLAVHGSKWRTDPVDAVLAQLAHYAEAGVRGVLFFDDNFFVSRKRVERIARRIIEENLSLTIKADCRADYLAKYDREFLELIRKAGFELLYIGAESGSDRMLEVMQKGVTVEQMLRANRRLAEAGIHPHYSFMCGLPGETAGDMRATVALMKQLKAEHPGAYLSPVKAYVPYPGTALFDTAKASGFEPPTSLEQWSRFDWAGAPSPWLSKKEEKFVQKMIYITAGLDPSVVELAGINQSRLAHWGFQQFAKLCQKRCDKPDLGLIPELPLVRIARRLLT